MSSKKILVRRYRMSYIPDCRTDNNYNEKYLNEKDREYLEGFDWCVKTVLESFTDNMNIYKNEFDINGVALNLAWFLENNQEVSEKLKECMVHFSEMERNTLITAMIEGMDEEEYKEIKARVDGAEN